MPQLDKLTYFTQFFWSCLFFFTFYILICNDRDGVLGISRILKLRNQLLSHRGNNIQSKDPNSLEDILRKGFNTGVSYMYSSLFEVSQWCKAVDLFGKRKKITLIYCVRIAILFTIFGIVGFLCHKMDLFDRFLYYFQKGGITWSLRLLARFLGLHGSGLLLVGGLILFCGASPGFVHDLSLPKSAPCESETSTNSWRKYLDFSAENEGRQPEGDGATSRPGQPSDEAGPSHQYRGSGAEMAPTIGLDAQGMLQVVKPGNPVEALDAPDPLLFNVPVDPHFQELFDQAGAVKDLRSRLSWGDAFGDRDTSQHNDIIVAHQLEIEQKIFSVLVGDRGEGGLGFSCASVLKRRRDIRGILFGLAVGEGRNAQNQLESLEFYLSDMQRSRGVKDSLLFRQVEDKINSADLILF